MVENVFFSDIISIIFSGRSSIKNDLIIWVIFKNLRYKFRIVY